MNIRQALLGICAGALCAPAFAEVTFYEGEDFRGRAFTTNKAVSDFNRSGFNNRASSVIVDKGQWEVCDDIGYRGRCVILREGSYESLKRLGVNNELSSVRRVSNARRNNRDVYSPDPLPATGYQYYEYRRRPNERVYEARVTSVRAVMGAPEQHCWVEREEVERRGNQVAGGIIGGVIGGILGHQIGDGKDLATAGGAVAGAAVGANVAKGRDGTRDVRRCETVQAGQPEYWDVRYEFRDREHRVQMSAPPGRTIYVNNRGEPRQ